MKTITYYISDYGFGHAARSIAIIRDLFNQSKEEVKVVICHSFATDFLKKSLAGLNVEFREIHTDVGYYLQADSIFPDTIEITEQYRSFTSNWTEVMKREESFLLENHIDIALSDISPLPMAPSRKLGIPSVGISNFSWYTAYDGMVEEEYLQTFKDAYGQMDYFFSLAGDAEPNWSDRIKKFGFAAREAAQDEVERIITEVNPTGDKTIIYFGLGMKVDIDTLDNLPIWKSEDCVFLLSSNMEIDKPNVFKIPKEYTESQNYIAASDLVISKAGWSTVSEAILSNKPLLVLDRNIMNEDKNTMEYLKCIEHVEPIKWEELINIKIDDALLKRVEKQKRDEALNQAKDIAINVVKLLK